MKDQELQLLRGMCAIAAYVLINRAEFDFHLMNGKKCADYQIRLSNYALCNVPFECTSKRIRLAKKLEAKGLIELSQHRKGGTWSFKFASIPLTQKIYDEAFEITSKFEIVRGKGFISLPQFSRTKEGFSEVERLGKIALEILMAGAA